jgi:hypothetical protein
MSTGGTDNMANIRIDQVRCIRKQDISGSDEVEFYIDGKFFWDGKMERDEILRPNLPRRSFSGSVGVELKELDGNSVKSLGYWTVSQTPTPPNNAPLTATSSGYHYEVYYDVF